MTTHRWLGHATVLVRGRTGSVAVDPWRWRDEDRKADVVLVTHGHADHCSEDDIAAASHAHTLVVGPGPVAERLTAAFGARFRRAGVGDRLAFAGGNVLTLPSEGPPRARGFHPRGEGVSYLAEVDDVRYLFLGDSAALPEHEGLAPDVAFFAVGGLAVTDPDEAAASAARVRPRLAVPVHWGDLNGRFDLARRFVAACRALGVHAAIEG